MHHHRTRGKSRRSCEAEDGGRPAAATRTGRRGRWLAAARGRRWRGGAAPADAVAMGGEGRIGGDGARRAMRRRRRSAAERVVGSGGSAPPAAPPPAAGSNAGERPRARR
ncbi:hypothetical protein Syun_026054 [Stephania yunnanensis]|uniref:Uncharacterized protein n=1 Tax=Stephania yunnanensis TaxID=152371 RepID=A0AAP0F1P4_9MAGN